MVWVQECLSLAKEYTKEDILQWFECRNVSLWLKNIPNKILLATILKSLWLKNIPKKIFYNGLSAGMSLFEYTKQDIVGYYFEC